MSTPFDTAFLERLAQELTDIRTQLAFMRAVLGEIGVSLPALDEQIRLAYTSPDFAQVKAKAVRLLQGIEPPEH